MPNLGHERASCDVMDANECLGERVSSCVLASRRGNLPALESGQIGSSLVQGQAPSSRATALCPTVLPLKKRPRDDWGCVRGGTGILVLVSLRKCQVPRGLEAQAMTRATRVTHWRHAGAVESFPGSESAGEGRQRVSPCRQAQPQLSQDQASSLD